MPLDPVKDPDVPFDPVKDPDVPSLDLMAERLAISKRRVDGDLVRVTTRTRQREHQVDEALEHEQVEIERVPIGRMVESVPAVREEGDTTIMPVVEEVVVVERRLMLKEEVRIRRVKVQGRHQETVMLREQEATITRTEAGERAAGDGRPLGSSEQPSIAGANS